jgi:hypothetical protein
MNKSPDSNSPNKNQKVLIGEGLKEYHIPVEGSLGLLALGAVGLKAWRQKRNSVNKNQQK